MILWNMYTFEMNGSLTVPLLCYWGLFITIEVHRPSELCDTGLYVHLALHYFLHHHFIWERTCRSLVNIWATLEKKKQEILSQPKPQLNLSPTSSWQNFRKTREEHETRRKVKRDEYTVCMVGKPLFQPDQQREKNERVTDENNHLFLPSSSIEKCRMITGVV